MNRSDLLYVAGAVMPLDKIQRNNASYNAGFFASKPSGYSLLEQELLDKGVVKNLPIYDQVTNRKPKRERDLQNRTDFFKAHNHRSEHDREAAARIAEKHRLVKGRKSPTKYFRLRKERQIDALRHLGKSQRAKPLLNTPDANFNHDVLYDTTERFTPAILNQNGKRAKGEPKKTPISMHLMHREWNNSYKFQAITETPVSSAPEANAGERFTEKLSSRSVSKIFEAAAYTSQCHGGFTTFLTLTFTKAQRLALFGGMTDGEEYQSAGAHHPIGYKRNMVTMHPKRGEKKVWEPITDIGGEFWAIPTRENPSPSAIRVHNRGGVIAGPYCDIKTKPKAEFTMEKTLETTIGREASRFLDAAKKMYQRGWRADHTVQTDPDSGAKYCDLARANVPKYTKPSEFGPTQEPDDFHYIWVAECPANEHGEPNPHIHVLLRWSVPPYLFSPWSKRLEKIWGHGFANLERIKKPQAAGSYIIKAVGYAAKGENIDQGLIRGNRYSISKCSRAPAWETLATFDADNMTAIIKELGYKLEQWRKPIVRKIRKLQAAKGQTIKAKSIAKKQGKPEEYQKKLYQRIIRLEKQAEKLSRTIKERGVHVSTENRFCITFDSEDAKQKVDSFMCWAAGARGWPLTCRGIDMSDIKANADEQYLADYKHFIEKRCYWQSILSSSIPIQEIDEAEKDYWLGVSAEYADGLMIDL